MNPTKLVIVLVSVCSMALGQEISEERMKILLGFHNECKADTNIDDTLASGVLTGSFPDDPVLKQHMFCMSKKLGVMNDAGEIQRDAVETMVSKVVTDNDKVTELVETCSVQQSSPEETAYQLAKCIYEGSH